MNTPQNVGPNGTLHCSVVSSLLGKQEYINKENLSLSTISRISHKRGIEHVTPVVAESVACSINYCISRLRPSCRCTGQDHLHIAILCCMAHILTTIVVDAYSINKPIHLQFPASLVTMCELQLNVVLYV